MASRYHVLTGPTAAGKTSLLVEASTPGRLLVISADSRQVYRHMDVGTGKASAAERQAVPHMVLDVADPGEEFSAFHFVHHAAGALRAARESDLVVWVCGGTGLYIRALVEQLAFGTAPRPLLRAALELRYKERSSAEMARDLDLELQEADNPVRVMRAAENACASAARRAEIYDRLGLGDEAEQADHVAAAGQQLAPAVLEELAQWECGGVFVLDPGTAALEERIRRRTQGMFDGGLLEETRRLRQLGFGGTAVVSQGIGYREAGQVLDSALGVPEAAERTVVRTRQYAKRQRTYFRGQGWPVVEPEQIASIVKRSLARQPG